jgi:hypothetical protein
MKEKSFLTLVGIIFGLVALLHLCRLLFEANTTFIVFSWPVPLWISVVGLVVGAFLSYTAFRLRKSIP